MEQMKKILVAVNWDDHDPSMAAYVSMIAPVLGVTEVNFVHVEDESLFSFPDPEVQKEFKELRMACTPEAIVDIAHQAGSFDGIEVKGEVVHGNSVLYQLIRMVRERDIDLLVVGRKNAGARNGTMAQNLVRKAPCSVMVVPYGTLPAISKVMVPVDFSSYSSESTELAVQVCTQAGLESLYLAHIYGIPFGYHKLRKTFDQMDAMARKQVDLDFEDFTAEKDLAGVHLEKVVRQNLEPYQEILNLIRELQVNLVLMGARGKGSMIPAFLGSTTELVIRETTSPLIAVKKKGSGNEIVNAIMKELDEIKSVIA